MNTNEIKGRRVAVIGGKRSGLAASKLLKRAGAKVMMSEREQPKDDAMQRELERLHINFEFGGHSENIFASDFAVISPGVPSNAVIVKQLANAGVPIYSEVEMASWFCKAKIIAITGTDGKTTTTAITSRIFTTDAAEQGYKAYTLGNIGTPFSDYVEELTEKDVAIVETSSFQLDYAFTYKPCVAVITNITPDHLDRYDNDFKKYAAAKYRIYQSQDETDTLIYNDDDEELHRHFSDADVLKNVKPQLVPLSLQKNLDEKFPACGYLEEGWLVLKHNQNKERLMRQDEISTRIRGTHNVYNSLAAALASRALEIRKEVIRDSIKNFEGVEHRLEFVRELGGTEFINDSKATTVNALWYALDTLQSGVVLIAGGKDKGNDYSKVKPLVRKKVKAIIAIGESKKKLVAEFAGVTKVIEAATMDEAVRLARREAKDGDTVLLSPACASFDMFSNFEERGEVYKRLVSSL
ncbi:MAG: UDP-N-acetylmuramoyl-L-alanine--D-glutamate ligase [Rhizobacter sp.]|nr:UDP-N-acetylmuramoyl-L-alanine--D-glutamate ligase [Chlorobiales bacterium]